MVISRLQPVQDKLIEQTKSLLLYIEYKKRDEC
jgi:hypothetical protein